MPWLSDPDGSFPELLFEFLNRGNLRDWCRFLSEQSSCTPAEKIFATGVNDFFRGVQSRIDSAEELRGTVHYVRGLDQAGGHRIGLNRRCRRRGNIGQLF